MKFAYRRMSVLLVDSASVAVDAMEGHLEPLQFHRIWSAKGAEEALQLLRDRPVDVVVTNWKLQPITGLQLLEMIRRDAKLRSLAVVVLRSPKDKHIEEKAEELGATALADLPIKPADLLAVVEQVLSPLIDEKEEEFLQQMDRARSAIRGGDLDAAEQAYRAALVVKVDEEAQVGLGKVLKKLGDLEGAEQAYIGALRANPHSLRAFLGLASVYQSSGRLEDALKVLAGAVNAAKKVKEAGSVQSVLYFYMGEIELQLKRLQQAMGLFEKAAQESPEDAGLQGASVTAWPRKAFWPKPSPSISGPWRSTPSWPISTTAWASPTAGRKSSTWPSTSIRRPCTFTPTMKTCFTTWPAATGRTRTGRWRPRYWGRP